MGGKGDVGERPRATGAKQDGEGNVSSVSHTPFLTRLRRASPGTIPGKLYQNPALEIPYRSVLDPAAVSGS